MEPTSPSPTRLIPPWQRWRREATVVINHNPDRLPRWPGLGATPEDGRFGRICWLNSIPSEEAWGRVWWSRH